MTEPITPETLAKQLRCPSGAYAKQVGENMFLSNSNMIFKAIDLMQISTMGLSVLEIGFGNGKHLPYLFRTTQNLYYTGVDISEEMVKEATLNNINLVKDQIAKFIVVQPNEKLPFLSNFFDYCFTVNTIYFIGNPVEYFHSVFEFLKPKGKLIIRFIAKKFGESLSFTQEGFTFYTAETITQWLSDIGFTVIETFDFIEDTTSKDGQQVNRPFSIVVAQK